MLGIARLVITSVSFRKIAPLLGVRRLDPWTPLLTEHQQQRALEIGRTIRTVACYTPWSSNCFAQAVVARILLGAHRIPYVIYFGLAPRHSQSSSKAHAWVTAGRTRVTGGESFGHFVIVGMYVSKKLARAD